MKKIGLIIILIVAFVLFFNHEKKDAEYSVDQSDLLVSEQFVDTTKTAEDLTEIEKAGILLMREEEKLARDVYQELADQWSLNIFSNIAKSEQTHMDAMKDLVGFYGIEDPVISDSRGEFTDESLVSLYNELVQKGGESIQDALIVGATIEDLDIYDLERLMGETNKENIITTYQNLQKGSRNHLRAFYKQIIQNNAAYEAAYITQSELEDIINSPQEKVVIR